MRGLVSALAPLAAAAVLVGPAAAQDEPAGERETGRWYPGAEVGLTLNQSAFSDNWSGGDLGSVSWALNFQGNLDRRFSRMADWRNVLKLAYGQTMQQEAVGSEGDTRWGKPQKSTDLIDFESLLRLDFQTYIDPFASVRLTSLFEDATDDAGRTIPFNPLVLRATAGISRMYVDTEDQKLMVRLGLTARPSRRRFFVAPPPSTETRKENGVDGGLDLTFDSQWKLLGDKVDWASKLIFYQPFFFSGKDELQDLTMAERDEFGIAGDAADLSTNLDIDWENAFKTQLSKVISLGLYFRIVFDEYDNSVTPIRDMGGELDNGEAVATAVRKSWQIKQTMSLGVSYKFM